MGASLDVALVDGKSSRIYPKQKEQQSSLREGAVAHLGGAGRSYCGTGHSNLREAAVAQLGFARERVAVIFFSLGFLGIWRRGRKHPGAHHSCARMPTWKRACSGNTALAGTVVEIPCLL